MQFQFLNSNNNNAAKGNVAVSLFCHKIICTFRNVQTSSILSFKCVSGNQKHMHKLIVMIRLW